VLLKDPPSEVLQLRDRLAAEWPAITRAQGSAADAIGRLRAGLDGYTPPETSFVVFGSLGRRELTTGSDLDWTLLLDGPADPAHRDAEIRLGERLRELGFAEPNAFGSFGGLTVGHDLIHKIGGDDDTNRNTTQRILLLLESAPVGHDTGYARVVHQVLRRYIEEDLSGPSDSPCRVPRFLQNDVARYWRTVTVDFAHKRRVHGSGWALRTVKLRMSRKLIYAAGLLSCFSCGFEFVDGAPEIPGAGTIRVVEHLEGLVRKTPLDIVARFVLQYFGELSGWALELFGAYDEFLAMLGGLAARAPQGPLARGGRQRPGLRSGTRAGPAVPGSADRDVLRQQDPAPGAHEALRSVLMETIGFSTGSLALGDVQSALGLLERHRTGCIELSALRVHELAPLLSLLPDLPLHRYRSISIHAPSAFTAGEERRIAADLLGVAAARGWLVVVHPDTIHDFGAWVPFGSRLAIENMDRRKPVGRTVEELEPIFARLPRASFCFDVAHARQVDPSMVEAVRLLEVFGDRLAEVHLSELDAQSRHTRLSRAAIHACLEIARLVPADVPVIIEAPVRPHEIGDELMASLQAMGRPLSTAWRVAA